ncbi:MAG: hypothetical protein HKL90_11350 [Elusimicrobia bacterium]|nr:hypothetical protein [Elusimicrobiota bacterium]
MMKTARWIAIAVFISLAVGEAAVRAFVPMDALLYQDSADPALGFELRPGAHGEKMGADVQISAQGLRDDVVPDAKDRGEARVVVVGGQETFGLGVRRAEGFVAELPGVLRSRGRVRGVNVSMYSYGLSQKVELACRRAAEFHPDVVVLQASEGDAVELPPPSIRAPRLKNFIRETSALARWIMERRYRDRAAEVLPPQGHAADGKADEARADLARLRDCLAPTGAKLAVAFVPGVDDLSGGAPSSLRRGIEAGAKAAGALFIDVGPALRRVPAGRRALRAGQPFLSSEAQKALSVELGRRLAPLLPRSPKSVSHRPAV